MIKILMAEDHAIVREGMKQLFALSGDITVSAEAVNGAEVLDQIRQQTFDLILLDMSMPGISGANLIARIKSSCPEIPILVLSMHNEPQIARRALNSGASGYLTKDSEPETLLSVMRKVAKGGRFIDPVLAQQMVFEVNNSEQKLPHELLSEREHEIFLHIARGKSLNKIAEQLNISNKTVSTHKMRLMQKMNFTSNAELVRYAVDHGLVG